MDVDGLTSRAEVGDRMRAALEQALTNEESDRMLVCRVVLEGTTPLHGALQADPQALSHDARAHALGLGGGLAWVEKVELATQSPPAPTTGEGVDEARALLAGAADDPALVASLLESLEEMRRRQPAELAAADPDAPLVTDDPLLRALIARDTQALISGLSEIVLARLGDGDKR
ncbi:hypothetical protein [Pararhodospirillum photometricum]|uniref:hypothetical protein n=1 Tax=Pararhodospirillum photometricum TaxID=1084 RepID=UPI0018D2D81D|nr:hypothetical protein [Pararhodospirillum photometricum]